MIAYRRRTKQWIKPPRGSQIDWSHPLAKGLAVCFLLNENNGNQIFDIVSKLSMPLTGSPTWLNNALRMTSASIYGAVVCPLSLQLQPPVTLIWQGYNIASIDSFSHIFGYIWSGGRPISFTQQSSTTVGISIVTNSSNASYGGMTIPMSRATQIAAVLTQETVTQIRPTLYQDGVFNLSGTLTAGTSISYGSTPFITFNNVPTFSFSTNMSNDLGYIYNVAQSPSNIAWLAAEPYAFIESPSSTKYFFLPSIIPNLIASDFAGGIY